MSIWGPNVLENDDAADWLIDLKDEPSLSLIRKAIEDVVHPAHGYIEVTEGAAAVAAAEVLAEVLGSPGDAPVFDQEQELAEVVEALKAELKEADRLDIKNLVRQAIDALELVVNDRKNSELPQMWEDDSEGMQKWLKTTAKLQERLRLLAAS